MKLDLKTDVEFLRMKKELEDEVDALIDSSKNNLYLNITSILDGSIDNTDEVLKIINDDLEEKRINLKKHFIGELEVITKKAFYEAISKF